MKSSNPTPRLVTTSDGSHSLFVEHFDENYHSIHGAIQESEHVFIQAGLHHLVAQESTTAPLYIFEMGFGTGLNVLLTYLYQQQYCPNRPIHYSTVEAFPISADLAKKLNYVEQLLAKNLYQFDSSKALDVFQQLHDCQWDTPHQLNQNFSFEKINTTLEAVKLQKNYFNLVYFDAFAPSAQAELWEAVIFEKLYQSMTKGAVMTTYCAKGVVKRCLKKVGFKIEALAGPPRKREITRAIKL